MFMHNDTVANNKLSLPKTINQDNTQNCLDPQ